MAASVGNFFLWISLISSVCQFLFIDKKINSRLNLFNINALLISSALSFFLLMYVHVISDFSVLNVFQNSHTTKPLIYKISGVWGNHEGSMLLWMLVLSVFNYFIYKSCDKKNYVFISKTLKIHAFIILGFLLFIILTSNPFEKIYPVPNDGLGFNPILQDPALAIHPPLLYIGYVGFSAAFAMSVAVLSLKINKNISWYNYMKPFVAAAWTFLTIGIALGSIWAYYELGWGGWWFWDPVENASFMPWLIGTALLHSLIIVEKRDTLKAWVLLLAILAFLLSVIGTFLVRSGILTSVHTFALDPSRGIYILIFIAILASYSLILFAKNSKNFINDYYFSFSSREGSILINNILMTIICGTVFLGTVYPLIIEALTGSKISVGEPYYNSTVIPIVVPAILVMGFGPILSWNRDENAKIFKKLLPSFLLTFLFSIIIFIFYKPYNVIGFLGVVLAFWIISNGLYLLIANKTKKHAYSMIISHIGIGFLILGITCSSVWQKEKIVKMKINDEVKIKNYTFSFKKINEIKGPNYLAIQGKFSVYNDKGKIIAELKPENRFYPITNIFTTEASINSKIFRDLYIVLGEGNPNDGWIVRIYVNPLVIWIWIGALTIFFGGVISINNNIRKLKIL